MITYRDRAFCAYGDKCKNLDCKRKLTEEDKIIIKAKGWMVSWMEFNDCKDKPKEEKENDLPKN